MHQYVTFKVEGDSEREICKTAEAIADSEELHIEFISEEFDIVVAADEVSLIAHLGTHPTLGA